MVRQLSSYEKTHLARYGKSEINISDFGEMPVEYITGKVEFCGRVFSLTSDVLIPRIETEELVNLAIQHILKSFTPETKLTIGDIGCGCGAIGITTWLELTKKNRMAQVYLADISTPAVEVAKQNLKNLIPPHQQSNFKLSTSDLLTSLPANLKFNVLLANLPYIPSERINYLDESVKDHEPHLALDGGLDGLFLIKKFLHQAVNYMLVGGFILLEIDYTHTQSEIANCFSQQKHPQPQVEIIEDSFNRQRFALIRW